MGGELAQGREWDHDASVEWHLLDDAAHAGVADWITALNALYRSHPSLVDDADSLRWISCDDAEQSVLVWARHPRGEGDATVWAGNFTPVPRVGYRIGLPAGGSWRLLLNGDDPRFGGSGHPVPEAIEAEEVAWHGLASSAVVTLPPLAVITYGKSP
jgi:1,4-alpha-glucan branching enzyme